MGKKKEKGTESKKTNDKADTVKGGQTEKPETRGTGQTTIPGVKTGTGQTAIPGKTKAVAGGIVAVAIGVMALVGFNTSSSSSTESQVQETAPAAVVQQQPVRSASEAAAASMIPQPLAPQKTQLAEPAKPSHELAKPSKESAKKSGKLASKAKGKDSVKKAVVSNQKQKAVKHDKKSKKTLAAKTID